MVRKMEQLSSASKTLAFFGTSISCRIVRTMIIPESGMFYQVPIAPSLTLCLCDRFWLRGTLLVVEYPKESSESGPRAIQLRPARDLNGRYHDQVWVLEERESRFSLERPLRLTQLQVQVQVVT
jgi:hypothetical protein